MCLIFLSYNQHPKYPFIALANRDEFFDRPAMQMDIWQEHPEIIAGRDLSAGGTWLGVNKSGHFAMLTNYRDLSNLKSNAPSRGKLVLDYLIGKLKPEVYLTALHSSATLYNGYNIILGSFDDPWYFSNQRNDIIRLGTGSYGLSNAFLDTKWPKVTRGKEKFNLLVKEPELNSDALFDFMKDKTLAEDDLLPDTGIGYQKEKRLSSMFIEMPGYGTRNTTLILKDRDDNIFIEERSHTPNSDQFVKVNFTFKITR